MKLSRIVSHDVASSENNRKELQCPSPVSKAIAKVKMEGFCLSTLIDQNCGR